MPLLSFVVALIVVVAVALVVNSIVRLPDNIKPVVNAVFALIVVGMALWLINTYVPMAESIKSILNIVVVVATCVFVLQAVGLWNQVVKISTSMWARITGPRPSADADKVPENAKPSEQH
jgi:predicted membrane protein